jgi:RimJ/RimL family protein N-acetyltransferase
MERSEQIPAGLGPSEPPPSLMKPAVQISVRSPFPLHALPRLWKWAEESRRQVADEFSPKTLDEFVDFWERLAQAGQRSWGVWRNGDLGGAIWSTRVNPVTADSHCIFKRTFWGQGITAEALRLAYSELFADGAQKITIVCFADNHALLGLVRKLGFEREGLLKKSTLRDGELVDQAVIGLMKERFEELFGGRAEAPVEIAAIAPVEEDNATLVL